MEIIERCSSATYLKFEFSTLENIFEWPENIFELLEYTRKYFRVTREYSKIFSSYSSILEHTWKSSYLSSNWNFLHISTIQPLAITTHNTRKIDATMVARWTTTPSPIAPSIEERWRPNLFYSLLTSICIKRCVGSFSATFLLTSEAIDHCRLEKLRFRQLCVPHPIYGDAFWPPIPPKPLPPAFEQLRRERIPIFYGQKVSIWCAIIISVM
jgi:hypothetical protein